MGLEPLLETLSSDGLGLGLLLGNLSLTAIGLGLLLGNGDVPVFSSCLKAVGLLTVESLLVDEAGLPLLLLLI